MSYRTIRVRFQDSICFLQLHRPASNNTINGEMVEECRDVLARCEESATVVVIEGLPEVFCFGLDFQTVGQARGASALRASSGAGALGEGAAEAVGAAKFAPTTAPLEGAEGAEGAEGPEPLYDLWTQLAAGSFVSVARVQGKVNAGGVGFVAACDIVLSDESAVFSLSELLFGLMPAIVMPFLVRRVGFQRAHYLTLMTKPITARRAFELALVDDCDANIESLLRMHLLRLRRLSKAAVGRYKRYMGDVNDSLRQLRPLATRANRDVFSDPSNLEKITRFVQTGQFPWE